MTQEDRRNNGIVNKLAVVGLTRDTVTHMIKFVKSVSFVDIKVIKEMRDGVKIIRRDGGMYKILGDVINPNEDNEDYLKRNILVDEIEKRSGIVIEYKRKQKDL